MIGEAELQQMKPGAILINCGRGGLIDEAALVAALKYGQIGGAGFDVLTQEPPRDGKPSAESPTAQPHRHATHCMGKPKPQTACLTSLITSTASWPAIRKIWFNLWKPVDKVVNNFKGRLKYSDGLLFARAN